MGRQARWKALGTLLSSILPLVLATDPAHGVEFVISGPRALGMGGAGVAATTDALATYWNPAALAMTEGVDIRAQGSVQAIDRAGMLDLLQDIDDINTSDISVSNQAALQGLLNRLNGTSVSALAAGGLYIKGSEGDHAFGINVSDVATGGLFTPTPLTAAISGTNLVVNGQLQANALEARQIGISYAVTFADKTFALGVTPKIIQGAAYSNGVGVFSAGDAEFEFRDDLGKANISTQPSIDAGAVYQPASWLRIGVVGKDLSEPAFKAPGGGEFKLVPQVRAGLALKPYDSLTIAFDGDITSNKTLIPGTRSQVLSLGAEQTLIFETLSLRVGALKNVRDAKSKVTPTAGLGLKLLALQLDVAGGYDFNQQGALASFSLGLSF